MGALVLDAGVIIATSDPTDAHHPAAHHPAAHQPAADRVVRSRRADGARLILPASARSEVLVGAFRQGDGAAGERAVETLVAESRPVDRDAADVLTADHRWARDSSRVELIA